MDMAPWQQINPCGLGVAMTQLSDLVDQPLDIQVVSDKLIGYLSAGLGYNDFQIGGSTAVLN